MYPGDMRYLVLATVETASWSELARALSTALPERRRYFHKQARTELEHALVVRVTKDQEIRPGTDEELLAECLQL